MRTKILAGVIALALSPAAMAATVSINPAAATAPPGGGTTPTPLAVQMGGDGTTVGFEVEVGYDTASLNAAVSAQNGASCANNDATGEVTVIYAGADADSSGTLDAIAAGPTTFCNITFTVDAGVADGTALTLDVRNGLFGDAGGSASPGPHTENDGTINVAATPVPLTLTYNPAAESTITFAGGALVGAAAPDQTITVTAAGTSGAASLTGCAITGAGAAAFSVAPTSLNFAAAGAQDLTVGCTHAAAASTATLTCSETDGDSAGAARGWPLSCPAGGVADIDPTVTSNPASGGTVLVSGGSIAALGTGTIDFTAAGGSGAGSTTINCTAAGGATIALSPGAPTGTTANQTITGANPAVDVRVGVTLTAAAQPAAGTVSCVLTGGTNATFTYTVAAPAGSAFTAPNVIPSASTWSKIALFGLLGMFGLLAVGFRRQG